MHPTYFIRYLLFELLIFSTQILPQRFGYWISLRLSDIGYYLADIRGREACMNNLRQALPHATRARITHETRWIFRNWGKYLTEFFRFRMFDRSFFEKHVCIMGEEHVRAGLARGRGVLVMSAHISNWELGAAAMCQSMGVKVNVVAAAHRYERINRLFVREREAMGVHVIFTEDAPRQVMRALKNNEVVCILADRDVTGQGFPVDYFGRECRFPQGPARFALQTGATLLPGFVCRRSNDSFRVGFHPPLSPRVAGSKEERARDMTQQFAKMLEKEVLSHPEEWSVFYNIWEEAWVG